MDTIAIIGIDGSGKSTQAQKLVERLNKQSVKAELIKGDHSNCFLFDMLERENIMNVTDNMKYIGGVLDFTHTLFEIKKKNEKCLYIWDRYVYCIMAYFGTLGVDVSQMNQYFSLFSKPHKTFLLDIDPTLALKRLKQNRQYLKPKENFEYLTKVREMYLKLAIDHSFIKIDASGSFDDVNAELYSQLVTTEQFQQELS